MEAGYGRWFTRQPKRGSESVSGKSPQSRGTKKVAQLSIKEKRAAKRAKREPEAFLKPRKGAAG